MRKMIQLASLTGMLRAMLCSLAIAAHARADSTEQMYVNPQLKFELSYPKQMLPADSHTPSSPLLLRSEGNNYPTFNVIVEPQALSNLERSLPGQSERVLSAYRRVGMTDAILSEAKNTNVNGKAAFDFLIKYSTEQGEFTSAVTIIPTSKFLYTLTFIDRSATFEAARPLLQSIVNSFVSSDEDPAQEVPGHSNGAAYLVSLGCLAFLIALALRRRRR